MRSDLQAVYVFIQFVYGGPYENLGEFDAFSGGSVSIDGKMYYPPGSDYAVDRGGKAEIDDGEITREWQRGRDDVLYRRLRPNLAIRYTRHIRLPDLSVVAEPFAKGEGLLSGWGPPEYDSQSADDSMLTLNIAHSGAIG